MPASYEGMVNLAIFTLQKFSKRRPNLSSTYFEWIFLVVYTENVIKNVLPCNFWFQTETVRINRNFIFWIYLLATFIKGLLFIFWFYYYCFAFEKLKSLYYFCCCPKRKPFFLVEKNICWNKFINLLIIQAHYIFVDLLLEYNVCLNSLIILLDFFSSFFG